MEEIWKDVVGYDGRYKISNLGRVKSFNYMNTGKEAICRAGPDSWGYPRVKLRNNGIAKTIKVHRLVAIAFIPNPGNKPQVNHKNGVKANNSVENLEWVTNQENIKHAFDNGLKTMPKGADSKRSVQIGQFTLDGVWVRDWYGTPDIKRELGFDRRNILKCINGLYKASYGYIWKRIK